MKHIHAGVNIDISYQIYKKKSAFHGMIMAQPAIYCFKPALQQGQGWHRVDWLGTYLGHEIYTTTQTNKKHLKVSDDRCRIQGLNKRI